MPETLRQFKASIFQALAHPTRIAIIELLRAGEVAVAVMVERLGVEPANLSQHLSVLKSKKIVVARKEKNTVFYTVRDPLLFELLDTMRRYFQVHMSEAVAMLKEMEEPV